MPVRLRYDFEQNPSNKGHLGPDIAMSISGYQWIETADGYMRQLDFNTPAFYKPTSFRENRLVSADFSTAAWTKSGSTITTGQADPNGGTSAYKLVEAVTTSRKFVTTTSSFELTHSNDVISIYAKAGERDYVSLGISNGAGLWSVNQFNLANGTHDANYGAGGVAANTNATITSVGDGWYRCSIKVGEHAAVLRVTIMVTNGGDAVFEGYSGDGSSGIYIWHPQHEFTVSGQTTPSEFLPPNEGTYTRQDCSAGRSEGMYTEDSSTNIALHSEDLDNAVWLTDNATVNDNAGIAPDGSQNAFQLIDDSGTGTGVVGIYDDFTFTVDKQYYMSIFAKADQLDWLLMDMQGMTTTGLSVYFDLTNGVVGSTPGANIDASGMIPLANGWYRCWARFTPSGADVIGQWKIRVGEADNDSVVDRDGTSSILLWGAALHQRDENYLPMYTTTAAAPVANGTNEGAGTVDASGWNADGDATWFARMGLIGDTSGDIFLIGANGGGASDNRLGFYAASGIYGFHRAAGVTTLTVIGASAADLATGDDTPSGVTWTSGCRAKATFGQGWDQDGPNTPTDPSVTMYPLSKTVQIGLQGGGQGFGGGNYAGTLKQVVFIDEYLDDFEMYAAVSDPPNSFLTGQGTSIVERKKQRDRFRRRYRRT